MVPTYKKKHQNKKLLSESNETSNDFVIGNTINADVFENEAVETHTGGPVSEYEKSIVDESSKRYVQEIEKNIVGKIRKEVHDSVLTTLDNLVISRVEMVRRSITGSSGRGPNSVVQNPDQRDF